MGFVYNNFGGGGGVDNLFDSILQNSEKKRSGYKSSDRVGKSYIRHSARKQLTRKSCSILKSLGYRIRRKVK